MQIKNSSTLKKKKKLKHIFVYFRNKFHFVIHYLRFTSFILLLLELLFKSWISTLYSNYKNII